MFLNVLFFVGFFSVFPICCYGLFIIHIMYVKDLPEAVTNTGPLNSAVLLYVLSTDQNLLLMTAQEHGHFRTV